MFIRNGIGGLLALSLVVGQAAAQSVQQVEFFPRRPQPQCDSPPIIIPGTPVPVAPTPATPPTTPAPKTPDQAAPPAPPIDPGAFAQAPAAGGELGGSFNPAMFGDLLSPGFAFLQTSSSSSSTNTSSSSSSTVGSRSGNSLRGRAPAAAHGSFKISDNESPRPMDRFFVTYNDFDRIAGTNMSLSRETVGFEKTLFGSDISVGLRLPFLQTSGAAGIGIAGDIVGDLTLIGKYAIINNRETGSVLSLGMALTVPSADHTFTLIDGSSFRSTLFQPYVGWIYNFNENFYAHAFHAFVIPSTSQDVTSFDNDIAIGYWLLRRDEGLFRGIVPTLEAHIFTPLNHTKVTDVVYAPNILTMTGGFQIMLPNNTSLGAAIAFPLTNPRPNQVEALVSFNFHF